MWWLWLAGCGQEIQYTLAVVEGVGTVTVEFGERSLTDAYVSVSTKDGVDVTAVPGEGYRFDHWSGDFRCDGSTSPSLELYSDGTTSEPIKCDAHFAPSADLVITVTGAGSGVVTLADVDDATAAIEPCATADGTCTYERGDATHLRLVATPDAGSKLGKITPLAHTTCTGATCDADVGAGPTGLKVEFLKVGTTVDDCPPPRILGTIPEVNVIAWCEKEPAVREDDLVEPPRTPATEPGFAVVAAGAWDTSLTVAGLEDTLGCGVSGVSCSYAGDPALTDGRHLVVAIDASGPFSTQQYAYGQLVVVVDAPAEPSLPDLWPGSEGAWMAVSVSGYDGETYADAVVGTGGSPDIGPPVLAPRAVAEGNQWVVLVPVPDEVQVAGVRVLSFDADDGAQTLEVWSAPGVPGWIAL